MSATVIEADRTWTGASFPEGVQIAVSPLGRIDAVGRLGREPSLRLAGMALLPGFVSAHSHAFQRALRGRGERFPAGAGSFWSWREAMYELVVALDRESLARESARAFAEMRDAGITTVGEFHYLHHDRDEDFAFDQVVLDAAAEVGIRIVLLQTFYVSSGFGAPLTAGQRRFATLSIEEFWRQFDALAAGLHAGTQSLGAAAHSVRAAAPGEVAELYAEAARRGLPFHMHVEEQRAEVEACRVAYGRTPMAVVLDSVADGAGITAIHATHTEPADLARLFDAGGAVCVCPLTEANLGDGIPVVGADAVPRGVLCLGSDSNSRLSMLEEMRQLEYVQRLRSERRGVLRNRDGAVAPALLAAATRNGARSLGLPGGEIVAGQPADFVAIRLDTPALAGVLADELLEALVFGSGNEAIAGTIIGGEWRPTGAGKWSAVDPTSTAG